MPNNTAIIYTEKDHVATITFNRPDAGNVINQQLAQELEDICHQINRDDNIYVAVIIGAGDKAFCDGDELERQLRTARIRRSSMAKPNDFPRQFSIASAVAAIDRPVIAAINGDALGQGLELALSCDIRLASERAHFGLLQVASGLLPMDGGTQRLPRIVGRSKALELILTANIIDAAEALAIGLVNRVVPHKNLTAETEILAQNIASKAPIALRYLKEAVNQGLDLTLEQGLRLEADLYFLLHTTADRTEGIKAFLGKRPPEFKGR
ncbi:MAG: enoyl-CoA hydratase/isomerase family protein [Chloroflexi bacterium]|nr:enoyl-CoA hydratase/isomerase family protein [Chloroflexota bacterium]